MQIRIQSVTHRLGARGPFLVSLSCSDFCRDREGLDSGSGMDFVTAPLPTHSTVNCLNCYGVYGRPLKTNKNKGKYIVKAIRVQV